MRAPLRQAGVRHRCGSTGTTAQHQLLPEWRSGLQLPGPGRHDSVAEPEVFASANDYKRLRPAPASCLGRAWACVGLGGLGLDLRQAARRLRAASSASLAARAALSGSAPQRRFPGLAGGFLTDSAGDSAGSDRGRVGKATRACDCPCERAGPRQPESLAGCVLEARSLEGFLAAPWVAQSRANVDPEPTNPASMWCCCCLVRGCVRGCVATFVFAQHRVDVWIRRG